LKHFENLTEKQIINELEIGEYFTYKTVGYHRQTLYRKGVKINYHMMTPVGIFCSTIEGAKNQ
jgi:hypothetical protein